MKPWRILVSLFVLSLACMLLPQTAHAGLDPNIIVPSGVLVYVPVTLTNSQSSPVAVGTPVQITVNWSTYATYLDNPVDNWVFFNSGGTKLNSWLESGTPRGTTAAVLWLKLDSIIPASTGTYTVYLGFTATGTSILNSSGTTGVAPNLCSAYTGGTYGSLDNGANVFDFYDNFKGTSLGAKWTIWNTSMGTVTVNNGVTITHTAPTSTSGAFGIFASFSPTAAQQAAGIVTETYFTPVNLASGYRVFDGFGMSSGATAEQNGYVCKLNASGPTIALVKETSGTEGALTSTSDTLTVGNTYTSSLLWQSHTLTIANLTNGHSASTTDSTYNLSAMTQVSLGDGGSQNTSYTTYWFRVRQAPPSNTMPTPAFGNLGGPATKLVFTTQPSASTVAGVAFATQPVVTIEDEFGNTVTGDNTTQVTLVILANPGGGTLSGPMPVTAASGVATFTTLSIDKSGIGYTLAASSSPVLTGATSTTFDITRRQHFSVTVAPQGHS